MALKIETFSNARGGDSFFKAIGHPLAQPAIGRLLARLRAAPAVHIYDPAGTLAAFAEIHRLDGVRVEGAFVQNVDEIGRTVLGRAAQPVSDIAGRNARVVFLPAFDCERTVAQMRHLVPPDCEVLTLDAVRLPDAMLANRRRYLDPLNFATNFAFFRDGDGLHTRLATANYWAGYGAADISLWLALFGADGRILAQWQERAGPGIAAIAIDSREVRRRFGLAPFTGQLFIHATGAAGHDVVKYALDTFGAEPGALSCTHDANAWPADYYAGLPAPKPGERVILWVQNSHPCPIPAGAVGLSIMGEDSLVRLEREVPPFGSHPVDVSELLPAAKWPQQIEIRAGRHFVRPRYEIIASRRRRIAHPNVERIDLKPDPRLPDLANLLGKGFILPAPVLPADRFRSIVLPTPMATTQRELPVGIRVYDASGAEAHSAFLGRLPRGHRTAVEVADDLLDGRVAAALPSGYGHMELLYDFREGGAGDGWLHALFRYEDRRSGHAAETSFGAHIFNTLLTYKAEPQSYSGPPPGLSTRLFLRLGTGGRDTLCHLIYPASTPWHARSDTALLLHDAAGNLVTERRIAITCSGSRLWRASEMFAPDELARAADGGYVLVRDLTCRLFGYHGLLEGEGAFSLDHMFGF